MIGFCMSCKSTRVMVQAKAVTMKSGKPATAGLCIECRTPLYALGEATAKHDDNLPAPAAPMDATPKYERRDRIPAPLRPPSPQIPELCLGVWCYICDEIGGPNHPCRPKVAPDPDVIIGHMGAITISATAIARQANRDASRQRWWVNQ